MRRFFSSHWATPLALLFVSLITYGISLSRQGFYWDDWFLAYFIRHFGPSIFPGAFSVDRPMMGRIYLITTSILGDSLMRWQIASLITRWLVAVAFWFFLQSIWPARPVQNSAASLLFLAYPGFQQQYIAITHTNDFIVLSLYLLSLTTMVLAIRKPSLFWPLYLLSLFSSGFVIFTIEYYFGLELVRPIFIWLAIDETTVKSRPRLLRTAKIWIPYAVIDGIFLLYRLTTETPRGQITIFDRLQIDPFITLMELGKTVVHDVWLTGFKVWMIGIEAIMSMTGDALAIAKFIAVISACFGVTALLLHNRAIQNGPASRRQGATLLLVGLFALIVAGIPYWMTELPIQLKFPYDRFTLPMMLGASLAVVGLVEVILPNWHLNVLILSAVVTVSAAFQYQNGQEYARQWSLQKDFFWQLAWRIPGLQPKTILMTSGLPFAFDRDDSLSAPLNWIYAEDDPSKDLSYIFYDVINRTGNNLSKLTPGSHIAGDYRLISFEGNLDQSLLIYYHPPDCLKVFDPGRDQKPAEKPQNYSQLISFSNPALIRTESNQNAIPPSYFGQEPAHGWCYYYQKAELARQNKDWNQVVDLADRAIQNEADLERGKMPELLPYIEGFTHTDQWDKAVYFTKLAYEKWDAVQSDLCMTWKIILETLPASSAKTNAINQIDQEMRCGF
jgi:hypothetical protein